MKVKVDMRVFRDVFGGPAPRIFQSFSDFKGFLRVAPTSQFVFLSDSDKLRGLLQISIGRFSPKFFGKRRKRRTATTLRQLKAFLEQVQTKIGFWGDTGVFVKIIVGISSQIGGSWSSILCDHLAKFSGFEAESSGNDRSAQQRLLILADTDTYRFGLSQFGRSQIAALSQAFNFCHIQFLSHSILVAFNSWIRHALSIR
jgi:hypothetical protein